MDSMQTWVLSIHVACLPRGAQPMAFISCFTKFGLMAFITMVEPTL